MKHNDPENYRNMSVPFETPAHANEALRNFMVELQELRKKHRICDVSVIVSSNVLYSDGEEGRTLIHGHFGDSRMEESMCAYALGKVQADRREAINKFLANRGTHDVPADKVQPKDKGFLL